MFRFPSILLSHFGEVFTEGFFQGKLGVPGEGESVENPIVLHQEESWMLEGFLSWALHAKYALLLGPRVRYGTILFNVCRYPLEKKHWVGVLAFSHKYFCQMGMTQSIDALQSSYLPATTRFRLAVAYNVPGWDRHTANQLLALGRHILPLSASDIEDIGGEAAATILQYQLGISEIRFQLIAFVVPDKHLDECKHNEDCGQNWHMAYTACTRLLANTEAVIEAERALIKLKQLTVPGMRDACFKHTLNRIEESGAFHKETRLREQGVEAIILAARALSPVGSLIRRL